MKTEEKIYIDNSRFMEFIDELATQITEMNFGADTFAETLLCKGTDRERVEMMFTGEAQEFYNEMYDEYEMMANNIMGVYSDNELSNVEEVLANREKLTKIK